MKILLVSFLIFSVIICGCSGRADEIQSVQTATEKYVRSTSGMKQFDVKVVKIEGNYAKAVTIPYEPIDAAKVYLQKVDGQWIVADLGTGIDPDSCAAIKFPSTICP